MKAISWFYQSNLKLIRLWGIVILICIVAFGGHGQSIKGRVDIQRIYESEIDHWLLSANSRGTQTSLLAAFIVHPFPDPADYSVCLVDSARHFFLELRVLDKNLWCELLTRFTHKQSLDLPLKTSVYTLPVSKRFKMKMVEAFAKMSPYKVPHESVFYDGITYDFRWFEKGEMKKIHISYGLKAERYQSGFIELMTQISSDLKNSSFKESRYIGKFQ
jgi:hypothetical protein